MQFNLIIKCRLAQNFVKKMFSDRPNFIELHNGDRISIFNFRDLLYLD